MARKRNRVSHAKEAFYILCILVILFIVFLGYMGPGGYLELKRSEMELESHRARVEVLKKDNEELLKSIQLLQSDLQTIESHARKKGYARKDEIIQEVPPQAPQSKGK